MKILNILILTILFFTNAQARVFNATEEIVIQPAVGFGVQIDSTSVSASEPLKLDASKNLTSGQIDLTSEVTGILPLANGGTGSATQNFVDLTTDQSVSGSKTFTRQFIASSTTEGYRPCPDMTEAQRDAIASPVQSDCVFNDDTKKLNVYSGSAWEEVGGGGGLSKWVTATVYAIDDVIWETATEQIYRANTAHTAGGTFAGDLANWDKLSYPDGLTANLLNYGAGDGTIEQDSKLSYVSASETLSIGFIDLDGVNAQISPNQTNDDLVLVGNGTGDVVLDGLAVNGTTLTTDASPADVTIQGNGTGEIILNDAVEFVSVSSPGTPASGNLSLFTDTTSGLLSAKDSNGIEVAVDSDADREVLANASFEYSHVGDPTLSWTVSGSATGFVETSSIIPSEGKQSLALSVAASAFELSQTFDCSDYGSNNTLGFTVYVSSTDDIEVCGFDGTSDVNCVTPTSDDTYRMALAQVQGGGTCGIKIKSDAVITDVVLVDAVKFTDKPYDFASVTTVTEWQDYTPTFTGFGTVTDLAAKYRRVGDTLEFSISARSGTTTAVISSFSLPSGLTASEFSDFNTQVGEGHVSSTGAGDIATSTNSTIVAFTDVATDSSILYITENTEAGATATYAKNNTSSFLGSSRYFSIKGAVKIEGWGASASNSYIAFPMDNNIEDWKAYTPTIQGFGTPTNVEIEYKKIGDEIKLRGKFTSGTATAVEAQIGLPSGYTIKQTQTGTQSVGLLVVHQTTNANGAALLATVGDSFLNIGSADFVNSTNVDPSVAQNGNQSSLGSSKTFSFTASVPVNESSSNSTFLGAIPTELFSNDLVSKASVYQIYDAEDANVTGFTGMSINTGSPIADARDYSVTSFPASLPAVTLDPRHKNKQHVVQFHHTITSGSFTAVVKDQSSNTLGSASFSDLVTGKLGIVPFNVTDSVTSVQLEIQEDTTIAGLKIDDVVFDDEYFRYADVNNEEQTAVYHDVSGYGSTNTALPYFATLIESSGNGLFTVTNDSTSGFIVTAVKDIDLKMNISGYSSGQVTIGITKNSTEGATVVQSLTDTTKLLALDSDSGQSASAGATIPMVAGDYVYFHSNANFNQTTAALRRRTAVSVSAQASNKHVVFPASSERGQYKASGHAGYGSTNTRIAYMTTESTNTLGGLGTVSNDSTNGWSLTADKKIEVDIRYKGYSSSATHQMGISVNSSQLTTSAYSITSTDLKCYDIPASANQISNVDCSIVLEVGDVLRLHNSGQVLTNATLELEVKEANASALVAFPFDRFQTNFLTADLNTSSTADVSDLRFTNLVVGETYEVFMQARIDAASTTGAGSLKARHNGSTLCHLQYQNASGVQLAGTSRTFVATASTVTFDWTRGGGATQTLFGDGTADETFVQLVRKPTTQTD